MIPNPKKGDLYSRPSLVALAEAFACLVSVKLSEVDDCAGLNSYSRGFPASLRDRAHGWRHRGFRLYGLGTAHEDG